MVEYGDIGSNQSQFILEQQYEFFRSNLAKGFENEKKLVKAREHLEKSGGLSVK
ncbi:MAG: hypothetical protein R8K53_10210 [Mariprofundaceae bacterium]